MAHSRCDFRDGAAGAGELDLTAMAQGSERERSAATGLRGIDEDVAGPLFFERPAAYNLEMPKILVREIHGQ